ncbi:hypothetical protein Q1695_001307 [Nippostrongylus brasiliensis]|nr:hypothetical protein Q1695_001307 [Nippostrongylus brasiliensis]
MYTNQSSTIADDARAVQFDTGVVTGGFSGFAQPVQLVRTALIEQHVNTIDPSFYDCVYNTSIGQTVIERCYKDLGCCATTCCNNDEWRNKYGWAVALIVIFCFLVVLTVIISLIVWLINRAKDKRQKRLLDDQGLSRATSRMSLAQSTPNGNSETAAGDSVMGSRRGRGRNACSVTPSLVSCDFR